MKAAAALTVGQVVSLQEALYWMNIQVELLAADQRAVRRMRRVMTVHPGRPGAFEIDLQLLLIEVDRVLERLRHWEEMVYGLRAGHR
ncbi:MAG TPA: hypothetical protein VIP78_08185 [Candidatus Dormibacteraeota bacterium]